MSIFKTTPDHLAKVMASGLTEGLKTRLREEIRKYTDPLIDDAVDSICKDLVGHIRMYREYDDSDINITVQIDGINRDIWKK